MSLPAIAYEPFWMVRRLEEFGPDSDVAEAAAILERLMAPLLHHTRMVAAADRERLQVQGEATAADTRLLVDAYGIEIKVSDSVDDTGFILAFPEREARPGTLLTSSSFTSEGKEAEAFAKSVGHLEVAKLPAFALERGTSRSDYDCLRDLCEQVARAYAEVFLGRELPE